MCDNINYDNKNMNICSLKNWTMLFHIVRLYKDVLFWLNRIKYIYT